MVAALSWLAPIDRYLSSLPANTIVTGFAVIFILIYNGTVIIATTILFDDATSIASALLCWFGLKSVCSTFG